MKFTFTGKKVNLSNRVQSYAEKKVGKLERYFKTEPEASLVFSVEKDRNKVELTIRSGGMVLRVAESTSDLFASIDAAVTSMERQLRSTRPAWRSACAKMPLNAPCPTRRRPPWCPTWWRKASLRWCAPRSSLSSP